MKKLLFIVIVMLLAVVSGCRSKKAMVKDVSSVELADTASKKVTKTMKTAEKTDITTKEETTEQYVYIAFADSGGRIEVLADGSVRMQGITAANGVFREMKKEQNGEHLSMKSNSTEVDRVGSQNKKEARYYEKKEKKQPPDVLGGVIPIVAVVLIVVIIYRRWKSVKR